MTAACRASAPAAILLDTNALLWLVTAPEKVSESVRQVLSEPSTEVLVSAASAWSDIIADMTAVELPHRRWRCHPSRPTPVGSQRSL